jgi:hypothetical protein
MKVRPCLSGRKGVALYRPEPPNCCSFDDAINAESPIDPQRDSESWPLAIGDNLKHNEPLHELESSPSVTYYRS